MWYKPYMWLLGRLWFLLIAIVAFAVVFDAGWLTSAHNRLGGLAVIAVGFLSLYEVFRRRRRA